MIEIYNERVRDLLDDASARLVGRGYGFHDPADRRGGSHAVRGGTTRDSRADGSRCEGEDDGGDGDERDVVARTR